MDSGEESLGGGHPAQGLPFSRNLTTCCLWLPPLLREDDLTPPWQCTATVPSHTPAPASAAKSHPPDPPNLLLPCSLPACTLTATPLPGGHSTAPSRLAAPWPPPACCSCLQGTCLRGARLPPTHPSIHPHTHPFIHQPTHPSIHPSSIHLLQTDTSLRVALATHLPDPKPTGQRLPRSAWCPASYSSLSQDSIWTQPLITSFCYKPGYTPASSWLPCLQSLHFLPSLQLTSWWDI